MDKFLKLAKPSPTEVETLPSLSFPSPSLKSARRRRRSRSAEQTFVGKRLLYSLSILLSIRLQTCLLPSNCCRCVPSSKELADSNGDIRAVSSDWLHHHRRPLLGSKTGDGDLRHSQCWKGVALLQRMFLFDSLTLANIRLNSCLKESPLAFFPCAKTFILHSEKTCLSMLLHTVQIT